MKSKEFINELAKKDIKQLNESLSKNRDKLHELRRDLALGKLKNVAEIDQTKKQIAQILTTINAKAGQIVEAEAEDSSKEPSDD